MRYDGAQVDAHIQMAISRDARFQVVRWMDTWNMNGWVDRWMKGIWIDGWMVRRMDGWMNGLMSELLGC